MRYNLPSALSKAVEEGIEARSQNKEFHKNPYRYWDPRYEDWKRGWKLESWRLNVREKIDRQISFNRVPRSYAESTGR